jgi:O-methyltransferase
MTFADLWPLIEHKTFLGPERAEDLYGIANQCRDIEGHMAVVGCCRGGVAYLLAAEHPDKCIYCFDTFAGLPPWTAEDNPDWTEEHRKHYIADEADCRNYLKDFDNISIHKGLFPATFTADMVQPYAFVHLDVDNYVPTRDALEVYWPLLSKGGIILIDDYLRIETPGVWQAVEEFKARLAEPYEFHTLVDYTCMLKKA